MEEIIYAMGEGDFLWLLLSSSSKSVSEWSGGFLGVDFENSESFSIKSFSLQVYKMMCGSSQVSSVTNSSWIGIAPPRVEILV